VGLTAKTVPAACWCRAADNAVVGDMALKSRTGARRQMPEMRDLKFASGRQARQIEPHHLCEGSRTVGIGAGQMSRSISRASPRARRGCRAEMKLPNP